MMILRPSDGEKIQVENQQQIAHLQSLLQNAEPVKTNRTTSAGESPKGQMKMNYPSLDAESLQMQ